MKIPYESKCKIDRIEEYLDENGNIDVDKMEIITFDYDTMKELDCWKTCQEIQMEFVIMMKLLAKE